MRDMPSAWNRTLSVLGVGLIFLLLMLYSARDSATLHPAFSETASVFLENNQTLAAFLLFFLAYVAGELLIFVGQTYKRRGDDSLRMHAISIFIEGKASRYWEKQFEIAVIRIDLFSGLMAIGFFFAGTRLVEFLQTFEFEAFFGLLIGAIMVIVMSYLITRSLTEIELVMDKLIEIRKEHKEE